MAFGDKTIGYAGGAVGDLLGSQATAGGLRLKAKGSDVEGDNYSLAATLAKQNEEFSMQSTAVKKTMAERQLYQTIGTETAQFAQSGLANSGSVLDILRDSATQGALTTSLVQQQGLIEQAGFHEQQTAYNNLAAYAHYAADVDRQEADTAERNGMITGGIKAAASIATIFATGGAAAPAVLGAAGTSAGAIY